MIKQKKGFTLAEVLLTLTIVGIVAALTIPSLMQNIQDQDLKVKWKKAFSNISGVMPRIVADKISLKGNFSNSDSMRDLFLPYLNVVKTCNQGANNGNCWPSNITFYDNTPDTPSENSGVILSDGTLLNFIFLNSNCINSVNDILRCGSINIDVNGLKGPNKVGKDIYSVHVLENRIVPAGIQEDGMDCTISGVYGWGCSAKYLKE